MQPHAPENIANGKGYSVEPVESSFIPSNKLAKPQILWVGCSSSWITETTVLDVAPEEIFVHRNLGNVLSYADLSSDSAIEYAIDHLKVNHIVICGHYDCRLRKNEFLDGIRTRSWSKDPAQKFEAKGRPIEPPERTAETERQEELHVLREVEWVKREPHVAKAIQERGVSVHGFIFDKDTLACVRLIEAGSE